MIFIELINLLSVDGQQSTKAVLAQTCTRVFLIPFVSETIFAMLSLPKQPADHHGTPG
jgi:hypothetical protein